MSNSLSAMRPELVREWSDKNLPLTPDKITYGSNMEDLISFMQFANDNKVQIHVVTVEADKEMKEASEPWDGGAGC